MTWGHRMRWLNRICLAVALVCVPLLLPAGERSHARRDAAPSGEVVEMFAGSFHDRGEGPPPNALGGIESLPVGIPDAIRRIVLNTPGNDTGLAIGSNVVVRVHSGRVVFPYAEVVHGIRHQVEHGALPGLSFPMQAKFGLAGVKEARNVSGAEFALLRQT